SRPCPGGATPGAGAPRRGRPRGIGAGLDWSRRSAWTQPLMYDRSAGRISADGRLRGQAHDLPRVRQSGAEPDEQRDLAGLGLALAEHRLMASGIDAAEGLPVRSMSLEMATVSGSPRCLAIAELMRPLAWWGMNAWIWSAETPDASRVRSDALEICTAAHRNTREPFIVTYGCSVAPSAAWSMSSRQFLVCVIASACSPSEPHTTGPTSLPLSDGPTTT